MDDDPGLPRRVLARQRAAWRFRREGDRTRHVVLTVAALLGTATAWAALGLHEFTWTWQPLLVVTAVAHFLMWVAPVAIALAVLAGRPLVLVVALVATVLAVAIQLPPTFRSDYVSEGEHPLKVMQANLRLGLADAEPLVRIVRDQHIDVLATEELTDSATSRLLAAGLGRELTFRYLRPLRQGGSGLGIWSRYPLSEQADLPHYWLGVVRARVAAPGGPVTVYAVHLTPPYPFDSAMWLAEMPRLRRELRARPAGPVIAAGDYNATTDHAQFRDLLGGGYEDAADQAGAGNLPSYPNDRWYGPVIGIDHVLVRDAVATSAATVDLPNSDHRGLITTVQL